MSAAQIAVRLAVGGPGTGAPGPHESHTACCLYNSLSELLKGSVFRREQIWLCPAPGWGADVIGPLSVEGHGCHVGIGGQT